MPAQNVTDGYDIAQICLNGHVANGSTLRFPAFNKKYCNDCGSETISACGFCPLNITAMAVPTIGVMVLIQRPEGLRARIEAMTTATVDEGDRWECRQLFMPDEHITLKWELAGNEPK